MLHRDAVEPGLLDLAERLSSQSAFAQFYLVGGTSLALQIGHRFSVDLDFFTHEDFDFQAVTETIESFDEASISRSQDGTVIAEIGGAKIDIIRHRYPLISNVLEVENLRLMGKPDIAAMKLLAIASRGAKKDFFDLHALLDEFELAQLLEFFKAKYPKMEPFQVIMSLSYFEGAEPEPAPKTIEDISWTSVKERIRKAAAALSGEA